MNQPESETKHEVTELLHSWSSGNETAIDRLVPLVYDELRRMAQRYLSGERENHTLQPTALVNEAYLRLVHHDRMGWQDRAHFFAIAARTMRRILVDHARKRSSVKRGGAQQPMALEVVGDVAEERRADLIALDDALKDLATIDPVKAKLVELRFFGGLSIEEAAVAMEASATTLKRQWRMAKAWIHRHLLAAEGNLDDA